MTQREQLEAHAAGLKKNIALRDAAIRLATNREFKKLILEYYIVEDVARLVSQSVDLSLTAEQRGEAALLAQGGGLLKNFLRVVVQQGDQAERDLNETRELLDELEGDGEGEEPELDGQDQPEAQG